MDALTRHRALALAAVLLGACPAPVPTATRTADPAQSAVTVEPAAGVLADGVTRASIVVTLRDAAGLPVPKAVVRFSASGSGNGIAPEETLSDEAGIARATLVSTRAETKTVRVSVGSTPLTQTPTVEFVAGAAAKLAFDVQPATAVAGAPLAPAVRVAVVDRFGNLVPTATDEVTLTLSAGPAGATLSGTRTVAAVAGVATFSDLSLDRAGSGYLFAATATGLATTASAPFSVVAAEPASLGFAAQPQNGTAGEALATVSVQLRDRFGNAATADGTEVTVALAEGRAALAGTTTATTVAGMATFGNLRIDRAGVGYALVASAGGLTAARSATFSIAPAAPSKLAFLRAPGSAVAGAIMVPGPSVAVQDAFGNAVRTASTNVVIALGANPSGGTLSGTTSAGTIAGVAAFPNLVVDRVGAGYTLTASAPGLESAETLPFDVVPGPAAQLAFSVQPTSGVAGNVLSAVAVEVRDRLGNPVTGSSHEVTLALGANPGATTLEGTLRAAARGGVATFSDLRLDRPGSGYTLVASVPGLGSVTSAPFDVSPGAATRLVFAASPSSGTAGSTLATVRVEIQDAVGNVVTNASDAVTLALGGGPAGARLGGTPTVSASAGVAVFSDLRIDQAGSGYTLSASAGSLAGAVSRPFSVGAAAASRLAFGVQPTGGTAGEVLSPAVTVVVQDAFGNEVRSARTSVTVALGTSPTGASLEGTTTATTSAGVATFSSLRLAKAGTYTLTAAATGLASAESSAFQVVPAAPAALAFRVQPSNASAGAPLSPPVEVVLMDAFGNLASSATTAVTLSISANPGGAVLSGTTTVQAAAGVATFADVSLNRPGAGYVLAASAEGLSGAESTSFEIAVGPPARLAFRVEPRTTAAGAPITPAVVVAVQDLGGNTVTTSSFAVTLSIGSNPGGGTLSGTTTVSTTDGIAVFPGLSIDRAGAPYTLVAAAEGVSSATSETFGIVAGAARRLAFIAQPTSTSPGSALSPPVSVAVQDDLGNTVTLSRALVTLSLGTNPSGATLQGTRTASAVEGVATFGDLRIDRAGSGYTLVASATGLTSATSDPFDVGTNLPTRLSFVVQPSDATAGAALSPAVQVEVQDASGARATDASIAVTVALGTNPTGATLLGTKTVTAVNGVATFPDLGIVRAGSGYTLVASAPGLAGATSTAFSISPATASKLAFRVQPANPAAGVALSPPVEVAVQDTFGNLVTAATNAISIALGSNPSSGTLSGTRSRTAVGGVAAFADLSIDRAGAGYTLVASADGLAGATSSRFTVAPGAPARLSFVAQPGNGTAGSVLAPPVRVAVQDALGNTVSSATNAVTVALGANPGMATLSGTTTVAASEGIATFSDLRIDRVGSGYTLVAAAQGLASATTRAFDVTPSSPTRLAFTVQPAKGTAGAVLAPAIQVALEDEFGNVVPTATSTVSIALGDNPVGATLLGTTSVVASGGVATFSDLRIEKAASGYTLVALAQGLTAATSLAFDVEPAAPARLVFAVHPGTTVAGAALAPAPVVRIEDAFGNLAPVSRTIHMALASNGAGGTLSGTTSVTAEAGLATFSNLWVDRAASGYTLAASADGLVGATSAAFDVTAAAADRLAFTVQPSATTAGAAIAPAVEVRLRDRFGNAVAAEGYAVSVALGSNPGGGTLTGTTMATTAAGVASFGNLRINKAGQGYTLVASATGLVAATSAAFDVVPAPAVRLAFLTGPGDTTAGAALSPAVRVAVQDGFGNTVTSSTRAVTISIGSNPGGATLSGTRTVAAESGVASFSDLRLDKAASGYTLVASSEGLASATSAAFAVTAGQASRLAFATQPSNTTAGSPFSVRVAVQDAFGNAVTAGSYPVTVALGANPGGGTLLGTTTATTSAGTATLSDLRIEKAGMGYTLVASASGLASATSSAFDVSAGPASRLAFTAQPSSTPAGATMGPVRVAVQDGFGNTATSATVTVTLSIASNPSGGTLLGTASRDAVLGVAEFADLRIERAGQGYTLAASANGLAGATSTAFDVVPATPSRLAFVGQPSNATAGAPIAPAVRVAVQDAFANTVTSSTVAVTVSIANNPAGGTLSGTRTVNAVSGVATFSDLRIDRAGPGYTLSAAAGDLQGATSAAFGVSPGDPVALAFTTQPPGSTAGSAFTVRVAVQDAFGNTVTTATDAVSVALSGGSGAALLGTTTMNAASGVATFSDLRIERAGTYTLAASAAGRAPAASAAFSITAAAAHHLTFVGQPTSVVAGDFLTPAVEVAVQDRFDNLVTTAVDPVTVALAANPGGGTLSGTATVAASGGIARFVDLAIDRAGTGYRLAASAAGLAGAMSEAFDVSPAEPQLLEFVASPSSATAGAPFEVRVAVRDLFGNTVTSATNAVTLTLDTNPTSATLLGTTTRAAADGVAIFPDLRIERAGQGYVLGASSAGLAPDASPPFDVGASSPTALAFAGQPPASTMAGVAMAPAVRVEIQDAFGNRVPGATHEVTLTFGANPGGGTLSGTTRRNAVDGEASFGDLSVDRAASGYTLVASAAGLAGSTSSAFDIVAGEARRLRFDRTPSNVVTAEPIAPPVRVRVEDDFGNLVTGATSSVTVALAVNPTGATLSGNRTVQAAGGIATFGDLRIDRAGSGYVLGAEANGLRAGESGAFDVVAWRSWSVGLDGGFVKALAAAPGSPTTVYAGTQGAGVFKTTDGGSSWTAVSRGLTELTVNALAIAGGNEPAIYAGTAGGVFKSVDDGASWGPASSGLGMRAVNALVLDPQAPRTLYAGTSDGVFKSVDGGASWTAASAGLTRPKVQAMAIDPTLPSTIYAGTDDGIFVTSNGGTTWTEASSGLGNRVVNAFALHASAPLTVYAATNAGVYKTTDGGQSWAATGSGVATVAVRALAIDPTSASTLYAGAEAAGVYKSTNGGGSWSPVNVGLMNRDVESLLVSPSSSAVVFAGTRALGVFRTTSGGSSWSAATAGITNLTVTALGIDASSPETLYAATFGAGVYKSTNSGASWLPRRAGMTNLAVRALVTGPPGAAGTLYAGTAGGVFKSTDGADTWTAASSGLGSLDVLALAIDLAAPSTVYAGTRGGLFKTTDGGMTWVPRNDGLASTLVFSLAIDPGTPTTLYAGTSRGVFKSTNGGTSWAPANAGFDQESIRSLAIHPTTPAVVFAGTESGRVLQSLDGGGSWTSTLTVADSLVLALAFDRTTPATVYAGLAPGGVRKTANGGGAWFTAATGLRQPRVTSVLVHPTVGAAVIVGVNGGGVYRTLTGGE